MTLTQHNIAEGVYRYGNQAEDGLKDVPYNIPFRVGRIKRPAELYIIRQPLHAQDKEHKECQRAEEGNHVGKERQLISSSTLPETMGIL